MFCRERWMITNLAVIWIFKQTFRVHVPREFEVHNIKNHVHVSCSETEDTCVDRHALNSTHRC